MTMNKAFERAYELGNRRPRVVNRQRLAKVAEEISRAGNMQLNLDACVAATVAFIHVLYATDSDGRPANYDTHTGRILIPVPWGSSGWRVWELRKWEATCYRRLLLDRVSRSNTELFAYDVSSRQWYVDIELYPDRETALLWLKDNEPTISEWREIVDDHRYSDMERKRAGRCTG